MFSGGIDKGLLSGMSQSQYQFLVCYGNREVGFCWEERSIELVLKILRLSLLCLSCFCIAVPISSCDFGET